jgi:formylglycine-generating enzyme required for sulfatase activity
LRRSPSDDTFRQAPSLRAMLTVRGAHVHYADPLEQHGEWVRTRGAHDLLLPGEYRIAAYLVTNQVFAVFVESGGYEDTRWWTEPLVTPSSFIRGDGQTAGPAEWAAGLGFPENRAQHPVTGISYAEASAFVRWLNTVWPDEGGWRWTLPSEDMWEFAARGRVGRPYPWGKRAAANACNSKELGLGTTTPVNNFPGGRSWCEAFDLAGNVWEFVEATDAEQGQCALRGGSYLNSLEEVKSSLRLTGVPIDHRPLDFGFRVAQLPTRPEVA